MMTDIYKLIVAGFILFSGYVFSAEAVDESIAQLIEEVKQTKDDARRKAMNRLKLKLRSLNEETRKQVMLQLRRSLAAGKHSHFSTPALTKQLIQNKGTSMHSSAVPTSTASKQPAPQQNIPHQPAIQQRHPARLPQYTSPHGGHP